MSAFRWHCTNPDVHPEHRIDGDGYYGASGYVCTGEAQVTDRSKQVSEKPQREINDQRVHEAMQRIQAAVAWIDGRPATDPADTEVLARLALGLPVSQVLWDAVEGMGRTAVDREQSRQETR